MNSVDHLSPLIWGILEKYPEYNVLAYDLNDNEFDFRVKFLKSFDSLKKLYVTKKDIENLRHSIEDKKCILSSDNLNAVSNSSIIFLTVQPKQFKGLAKEIKSHINSDQIIISPITGISIKDLEDEFGNDKKITLTTDALVKSYLLVTEFRRNN